MTLPEPQCRRENGARLTKYMLYYQMYVVRSRWKNGSRKKGGDGGATL